MSKRILIVEDQLDTRRIIRDMLASTDYEIIEAEDGEQALAAIAKQRPDLILMDVQLPITDGYTATRRIKADPALRSITIIAVTSYALDGEEKTAKAAGCDDYVPSPAVRAQGMSQNNMGRMPGMGDAKKDMTGSATGTISAINAADHKVTLNHGPITEIKWPAMQMEFPVLPSVDLSKVKVGDKVRFTVSGSGNKYTVQSINPAP